MKKTKEVNLTQFVPDVVLLEEVVGDLGGEEAVARLRLLRDEALQHVLEGDPGAPHTLLQR